MHGLLTEFRQFQNMFGKETLAFLSFAVALTQSQPNIILMNMDDVSNPITEVDVKERAKCILKNHFPFFNFIGWKIGAKFKIF